VTNRDFQPPDLSAELTRLLTQVPIGRVTTYGDLADALGLRAAARWVGEFLREHEHTPACVCHRVVRKGGELGLYLRDRTATEKAARLEREGVEVEDGVVEHFEDVIFRGFRTRKPLARLTEIQHELGSRVREEPLGALPPIVAGLDVSYAADGCAVGGCAVVETDTGHLVWSATHRIAATLPYIPSLLTFRELPSLLALAKQARRQFAELNLFFVDGNGILHPRGAGVAACFGVVADVPTVGVAKSQLCGQLETELPPIEGCTPLSVEGKVTGAVFRRSQQAHRLYISPGQRIDLAGSVRAVRRLDFGHRLPEPLYWADRLSRAEAKAKKAKAVNNHSPL
jgi:deoxyribonuclease V